MNRVGTRDMSGLERYVGQVLDEKYRLERLLGQGGMGAVFLASHLGTERYVALKLIAPQFMRHEEFVERFKREARAAGRLRHPNVVDVTDFGFARAGEERVAYLVMEYLDGCTLSDVLAEEERLPLYWVVDILEQVCSAVHEAHLQGIVHRDLKPDNIWLEPNRLGGYRVKVLDFGIAKLAESDTGADQLSANSSSSNPPALAGAAAAAGPAVEKMPPTDLNAATLIQHSADVGEVVSPRATRAIEDGDRTQLFEQGTHGTSAPHTGTDPVHTAATTGLTRVGAILGTPLYMSPEQCRGQHLDARSDIYSLGIIAYQMLSGAPPFTGDPSGVIHAHHHTPPRDLREQNPKLRKRVARLIMTALAKDPAERPQTAVAFANSLRATADGLGTLYRRAFALYSEYFPKFVKLSLLAHIPVFIVSLMLLALRLADSRLSKVTVIVLAIPIGLLQLAANFVTSSIIAGVTTIMVTQVAVAPLKPVELRAAFDVLRRRWRPFLRTGIRVTLRIILGFILCIIPGIVMTVRYCLWAPVVLTEGLEKKEALKRARALAARSWWTIILVVFLQFLVPILVGSIIGVMTGATAKENSGTVQVKITSQLSVIINVFVLPLMSIVPALLYLKMRQLGGETLNDVMAKIEADENASSKWQQRMRTRLTMNTPHNRTPTT